MPNRAGTGTRCRDRLAFSIIHVRTALWRPAIGNWRGFGCRRGRVAGRLPATGGGSDAVRSSAPPGDAARARRGLRAGRAGVRHAASTRTCRTSSRRGRSRTGRTGSSIPRSTGRFDWHSCVEMHWVVVRLLRLFPDAVPAAEAARHARRAADRGEHRGRGGLLRRPEPPLARAALRLGLAADARTTSWRPGTTRTAGAGRRPSRPWPICWPGNLVDVAAQLTYPQRTGVHPNTAFALSRSLDEAQRAAPARRRRAADGDPRGRRPLVRAATPTTRRATSPPGADFLSPALAEAELMSRVLPPAEFPAGWRASSPASRRVSRPRSSQPAIGLGPDRRPDRPPARPQPQPGLGVRRACRAAAMPATPGSRRCSPRPSATPAASLPARRRQRLHGRALAGRLRDAAARLTERAVVRRPPRTTATASPA